MFLPVSTTLKSSIPIERKEKLKLCSLMPKNIPSGNIIKINNKIKTLENITCKDIYFTLSTRNYNVNNACNYVYMNICKPPAII